MIFRLESVSELALVKGEESALMPWFLPPEASFSNSSLVNWFSAPRFPIFDLIAKYNDSL